MEYDEMIFTLKEHEGNLPEGVTLEALKQVNKSLPDMLEALKLLQSALTYYGLRDVKKRFELCVADALASKAIAKAEGRI